LAQIDTEEFTSMAKDTVKATSIPVTDRLKYLECYQGFKASETQGLPYLLKLKTTAKYVITVNINTNDGLVNGASGQLMEIDHIASGCNRLVSTLWLIFTHSSVGVKAKAKKPHAQHSDWTPIEKTIKSFQYKRNIQVSIERLQFPVNPAEAITIHKSQGATYSKVVVSLDNYMPRATSASGLYLLGKFNPP